MLLQKKIEVKGQVKIHGSEIKAFKAVANTHNADSDVYFTVNANCV